MREKTTICKEKKLWYNAFGDVMNCENCVNYVFDEETEEYICVANLDEDEYVRLLSGAFKSCPYFRLDDEYGIVRKQN